MDILTRVAWFGWVIFMAFTPSCVVANRVHVEASRVTCSEDSVAVSPGGTHRISDRILLKFRSPGTGVPDLLIGSGGDSVWNEPLVRRLVLPGTAVIYDGGKRVVLRMTRCDSADVQGWEEHVDSCSVFIKICTWPQEPQIVSGTFVDRLPSEQNTGIVFRDNHTETRRGYLLRSNPLLFVAVPEFFIMRFGFDREWFGGAPETAGARDKTMVVWAVTNFGVAEFEYLPKELYEEAVRSICLPGVTLSCQPKRPSPDDDSFTSSDFDFVFRMGVHQDEASAGAPIIMSYSYERQKLP